MGSCTVISDPDAAVGFRLAGVEALGAAGPAEAERLLADRLADGTASVVLLSQDFLEAFSEGMRRKLERLGVPLVIPIPLSASWWREERAEDYILDLIRRSIGFQMRIGRG